MSGVLTVDNLNIYADTNKGFTTIVKGLSFEVKEGKTLALVGESGCGKTMTALAIMSLLPPNCRMGGTIKLDGVRLDLLSEKKYRKIRGREIVFIPQSGADYLNPVLTIRSQMREAIYKDSHIRGKKADGIAVETLSKVGLTNGESILGMYPFMLSGGMAQRVILALSVTANPRVVILDEATRGIDTATANIFLKGIDRLFPNACKVVITHNMGVAMGCDEILVLKEGVTIEYGDKNKLVYGDVDEYVKKLINAKPWEIGND